MMADDEMQSECSAESQPAGPDPEAEDWYTELERPEHFYSDADKYWKTIPSTVDGMLGGFGNLSSADVSASKKFLMSLISGTSAVAGTRRVLDCGAGIGRVSKRLLLPLFSEVDLLEQNPTFLEKAKTYLGPGASRVGNYFATGMQDFSPEEGRYDVIWIQWVIGHLTDDDFVSFLQRCTKGLSTTGGIIVVKDNISACEDVFDEQDSSVTRCEDTLLTVFRRAGLRVVKEEVQGKFPSYMFEVKMFALQKL